MEKVVAIIQARMGSTRLPGKIMKKIKGKTVLEHVINRVRQSKYIDEIVIATTELERDLVVVEEAKRCGVSVYRGSEEDVLSRYYHAGKENRGDIIVRITSDCPLIDAEVVDSFIQYYKDNDYALVTNAGSDLVQRTYPRGLDAEVFSFKVLEEAYKYAERQYQREHVTPYIYENYDKIYYYKNDLDYSKYRWTLDTEEDFQLIETVYQHLYQDNHKFSFTDILNLLKKYPELTLINAHVEQKKVIDNK